MEDKRYSHNYQRWYIEIHYIPAHPTTSPLRRRVSLFCSLSPRAARLMISPIFDFLLTIASGDNHIKHRDMWWTSLQQFTQMRQSSATKKKEPFGLRGTVLWLLRLWLWGLQKSFLFYSLSIVGTLVWLPDNCHIISKIKLKCPWDGTMPQ